MAASHLRGAPPSCADCGRHPAGASARPGLAQQRDCLPSPPQTDRLPPPVQNVRSLPALSPNFPPRPPTLPPGPKTRPKVCSNRGGVLGTQSELRLTVTSYDAKQLQKPGRRRGLWRRGCRKEDCLPSDAIGEHTDELVTDLPPAKAGTGVPSWTRVQSSGLSLGSHEFIHSSDRSAACCTRAVLGARERAAKETKPLLEGALFLLRNARLSCSSL